MKVSSRAEQKNVILNKNYYTEYSIRKMLDNHEICYFDDDFNECYDWYYSGKRLCVFLEKGDELRVELDGDSYRTVLIKANGLKYFIILL